MEEEQAGRRRGTLKGHTEGVEETAKRLKALEWTRAARRAVDCGSVAPGLILDDRKISVQPVAYKNISVPLIVWSFSAAMPIASLPVLPAPPLPVSRL